MKELFDLRMQEHELSMRQMVEEIHLVKSILGKRQPSSYISFKIDMRTGNQ